MPIDAEKSCVSCDHEFAAHAHNRPGTDCGLCDCARFRGSLGLGAALRSAFRRREAAVRRPAALPVAAGHRV